MPSVLGDVLLLWVLWGADAVSSKDLLLLLAELFPGEDSALVESSRELGGSESANLWAIIAAPVGRAAV